MKYDINDNKFLYEKTFMFIKGYASGLKLTNTLKALPLCISIHKGQFRHQKIVVNGHEYQVPYCLHCLKVCSTLISLNLPLKTEDLDIMLAAALLHDTLEDHPEKFPLGGEEFIFTYGLSRRVYEIVLLLTKRHGASKEELVKYFSSIGKDPLALMIKLSDRSHNSESLFAKVGDDTPDTEWLWKYIQETREMVMPLAHYGKNTYPEFSNGITILKSKIASLMDTSEALVRLHENQFLKLSLENSQLKTEIQKLKEMLKNGKETEDREVQNK